MSSFSDTSAQPPSNNDRWNTSASGLTPSATPRQCTSSRPGVELNVIRAWLGHVSIVTTSQYIEIDMKMKREALERCESPAQAGVRGNSWHLREDLIQWLHDL